MSKKKTEKNSIDPDLFVSFKKRELELVARICKTIAVEYGLPVEAAHPATPQVANALFDVYTAGYSRALKVNEALEAIGDKIVEDKIAETRGEILVEVNRALDAITKNEDLN